MYLTLIACCLNNNTAAHFFSKLEFKKNKNKKNKIKAK